MASCWLIVEPPATMRPFSGSSRWPSGCLPSRSPRGRRTCRPRRRSPPAWVDRDLRRAPSGNAARRRACPAELVEAQAHEIGHEAGLGGGTHFHHSTWPRKPQLVGHEQQHGRQQAAARSSARGGSWAAVSRSRELVLTMSGVGEGPGAGDLDHVGVLADVRRKARRRGRRADDAAGGLVEHLVAGGALDLDDRTLPSAPMVTDSSRCAVGAAAGGLGVVEGADPLDLLAPVFGVLGEAVFLGAGADELLSARPRRRSPSGPCRSGLDARHRGGAVQQVGSPRPGAAPRWRVTRVTCSMGCRRHGVGPACLGRVMAWQLDDDGPAASSRCRRALASTGRCRRWAAAVPVGAAAGGEA